MSKPKLSADLVVSLVETGQVQMPKRFTFRQLEIDRQWEYQRRNNAYQMFHDWAVEFARQRHQTSGTPVEQLGSDAKAALYAAQLLSWLGLSGYTPPPWTDYSEHPVNDDDLSGARPVSRIDLIAELMREIDEEQADLVISLLAYAVAEHRSNSGVEFADLRAEVVRRANDWLCESTNTDIVYLNVKSTIGSIKQDVQTIWDEAQEQQDSHDMRLSRIDETCLFAAWDQREGFGAGRYEPSRERKLSDIVLPRQEDGTKTTPRSAYLAAFRMIVGQEYSPEVWFKTVGLMKIHLSGLGEVAKRRPRKSKAPRDIAAGFLDLDLGSVATSQENENLRDLQIDYAEAREHGLDDAAICARLEINPEQLGVLASLSEAKRV